MSPLATSREGEGVQAQYRHVVVGHAERFVRAKFAGQDVSHDWHHLHRVRLNALRIARSLQDGDEELPTESSNGEGSSAATGVGAAAVMGRHVNLLIVELAALLHDMCDRKYLPAGASSHPRSYTALAVLSELWDSLPAPAQGATALSDAERETIERIVDCVSWSKDQERRRRREARREKRRALQAERREDERTRGPESILSEEAEEERRRQEEEEEEADVLFQQWEASCPELWCVSDADRLDAIGSIGILRCAAYSAIKNRPLHIFPSNPGSGLGLDKGTDDARAREESCLAHFDDKLLKIHGDRLYTPLARREAERRQEVVSFTPHWHSQG
ncbi:hypothetical protein BCV69DRAFT_285532 [Microstroma glucosiphilum]|uniref:HD/PDEase domain-containing protein n=1 Tax=Pseudomicrostroma glucosiphilum TaxID=1684307 RepID=A0A316TXU7_9BASI|nr:hypothetical protein BCV69DRAFT_285532 [Pseudomicrostroma glucosiphilum]PWN17940.1 hypothetical protein BCV69DRAFT_285532 [Pseudomicrostroma glucosiphilum]